VEKPKLKAGLPGRVFHGLKAMASTVSSLREVWGLGRGFFFVERRGFCCIRVARERMK
jgi:hypothetical protein